MDRKNIQVMVNLTGGYEKGLGRSGWQNMTAPTRAAFLHFTEPSY